MTVASDPERSSTQSCSSTPSPSSPSPASNEEPYVAAEGELDSLLLEVQRRAAALTVVMGVQDDAGIQIAESRLRRTAAVARETASRLRSSRAYAAKIASFDRVLGHASFLLTLSSLSHREWAVHRALRWFECVARTCLQTGVRFRASGPDLFEVNAPGRPIDGANVADLHVEACAFSSGSLQCAVFDRAHVVSCNLQDADLRNTSWRKAAVYASSLVSSRLADAKLDEAVFVDCDLRDADLSAINSGATARDTRFVRCDLRGTRWGGRQLERASFINCKMHGLRGSPVLIEVCVRGADLSSDGNGYGSLRAPEARTVWTS